MLGSVPSKLHAVGYSEKGELAYLTSYSCYKMYFSSYLQVVYNLSISQAGYVGNVFNIVSCAIAAPIGL